MQRTSFNSLRYLNDSKNQLIRLFIILILLLIVTFISYKVKLAIIVPYLLCGDILYGLFFLLNLIFWLIATIKSQIDISLLASESYANNSYDYYHELPNNYGIGVATILLNSTLENKKDLIAAILDLCSKGYLKLTKVDNNYQIKVLKKPDSLLLENEQYLMDNIINNNLKNISYGLWFTKSVNDGINLGLFNRGNIKKNELKKFNFKTFYSIIITILVILVILYILFPDQISKFISEWHISKDEEYPIFKIIISLFGCLFYAFPFLTAIYSFISGIYQDYYAGAKGEYLEPTDQGKEEIRKLLSFKKFMQEFGNFEDKTIDEINLWSHYIPYAEVFGLTKKIMKTGYKELVSNSSFDIKSLDDIKLNKIILIKD